MAHRWVGTLAVLLAFSIALAACDGAAEEPDVAETPATGEVTDTPEATEDEPEDPAGETTEATEEPTAEPTEEAQGSLFADVDITAVCGDEPLTVALADGFGSNSWRRITRAEFEDEASKCPNIEEVLYTNAEGDQQRAISDINSLVAQGVDALVVFADFGAAELPAIRAATEAGVAVVPYLADPGGTPGEDYVEFIDEDRAAAGSEWADWMGETVQEGDIVFLGGIPGNPSSMAFIGGLKEGLAQHSGINLLTDEPVDTNWDPAETQRVTAGLLTQYDQIDGIVTDYGTGSVGAIRAYIAANEPIPPMAALASSNELGCLWEEHSEANPDFELMSLDGTTQIVRLALGKAVAAAQELDDPFPAVVELPVFMNTLEEPAPCEPDLPPDADLSSSLSIEELKELFAQ